MAKRGRPKKTKEQKSRWVGLTLSPKAYDVFKSIPRGDRSRYLSEIIEKSKPMLDALLGG